MILEAIAKCNNVAIELWANYLQLTTFIEAKDELESLKPYYAWDSLFEYNLGENTLPQYEKEFLRLLCAQGRQGFLCSPDKKIQVNFLRARPA